MLFYVEFELRPRTLVTANHFTVHTDRQYTPQCLHFRESVLQLSNKFFLFGLGLLAHRDVLEGSLEADYSSLGIAHRLANGAHPDQPSLGSELRKLNVVGSALPRAWLNVTEDLCPLLWRQVSDALF